MLGWMLIRAIAAVARKLLKRVYGVWKRKEPYQSRGSD
jgi:hypothetical protein